MAAFEFNYTANPHDLDAFREEGIRRLQHLIDKGFDTRLSASEIYDILYQPYGRILCVISQDAVPVGMAVLVEHHSLWQGTHNLFIEAADADHLPGLLEAMIAEWDRLAAIDGYDSVRFQFNRRGWLKKMKMYESEGYKVTNQTMEKRYEW